MASQTLARRFVVHGRVQGVGFRYFVQNEARELGLAGYVKNRGDGTVEVYASGKGKQLENLRDRLQQGPRWSRVERIDEAEAPIDTRQGFRIEY